MCIKPLLCPSHLRTLNSEYHFHIPSHTFNIPSHTFTYLHKTFKSCATEMKKSAPWVVAQSLVQACDDAAGSRAALARFSSNIPKGTIARLADAVLIRYDLSVSS